MNLNFNSPLTGTTGDDFLMVGGNIFGHQVDLGSGTDTIIVTNGGATLNMVGVENLNGTAGNEFVSLVNNVSGLNVDLGGGADNLVLAAGINSVSIVNTQNVGYGDFGATISDDTLTLLNNVSGLSVNMGNGDNNTLNFWTERTR